MTYIGATNTTVYLSQDEALPPDVASSIYTYVDRPAKAVLLRNRSLAQIQVVGGNVAASSLPIYLHKRAPCTYATIAGIVVAITQKDRRCDLMIDDGTQIIDVTIHSRCIPESLLATLPSTSRLTLDSSDLSAMPTLAVEAGDLVKVTGKIWRRQWINSRGRCTFKVGMDVQSCQLINHDPTEEARHNLQAHALLHTEYDQVFAMPSDSVSIVRIVLPLQTEEAAVNCSPDEVSRMERKFSDDLRALHRLNPGIPLQDRLTCPSTRAHRSASKRALSEEPRTEVLDGVTAGRRRRLLRVKIQDGVSEPAFTVQTPPSSCPAPPTIQSDSEPPAEGALLRPKTVYTVQDLAPLPFTSQGYPPLQDSKQQCLHSSAAEKRQLRTPAKLRDSQCTVDLFRLHVQKFLTDHHRFFTTCEQAVRTKQRDHAQDRQCTSPVFSIHFLMTVKRLWELADRVVDVMIRSREKRDARKGLPPPASGEPKSEKMRRLFERCVRQLVNEGYVVIAAASHVVPGQDRRDWWATGCSDHSDGTIVDDAGGSDLSDIGWENVDEGRQESLPLSLLPEVERWKRQFYKPTKTSSSRIESYTSLASSSSSSPPPHPPPLSNGLTADTKGESYQLLTPSLLIPSLEAILRHSSSSSSATLFRDRNRTTTTLLNETDIANLTQTLKRRDDRWQFLALESVKEALLQMGGGELR